MCHDLETCCDTVYWFESVEVDDLIVAQRGIGPLSIRSRVNQPPEVSDGNFCDFYPTKIYRH